MTPRESRNASILLASLGLCWAACGESESPEQDTGAVATSAGGGSGASGLPRGSAGTEAEFFASMAEMLCLTYEPCCLRISLPVDRASCESTIAASLKKTAPNGAYDPGAGQKCLDGYHALFSAPKDFCVLPTPDDDSLSVCAGVLKDDTTFTRQQGQSCSHTRDCALPASGRPDCLHPYPPPNGGEPPSTGVCSILQKGKSGDGPCIANIEDGAAQYVWPAVGQNPPTAAVLCDRADGLRCEAMLEKCFPIAQAGQSCMLPSDCADTDFCSMGACTPRHGEGESCAAGSSSCDAKSWCDPSTKKCAARYADGAACSDDSQCESSICDKGICHAAAPRYARNKIFCGVTAK